MSAHPEIDLLARRTWQPVVLDEPRALADIPTPALLLDEALLRANVERMASYLAEHGKAPRPHAKTHKCPMISKLQLDHGAVGVCTAKISEAFVQANAGIADILITSPVTTMDRVELLSHTNRICAGLKLVIDSPEGFAVAERAGERSATPLGVVLDVDVEMGRTGSRDPATVLLLADRVAQSPHLKLRGLQHYAGHLMHVESLAQRTEKSLASWHAALELAQVLQDGGHELEIITGGGTGSFDIDVGVAAITDLQVGSYIFMDQEYLNIEGSGTDGRLPFAPSLRIQASAISQPVAGVVTLDSGYKAMASETVMPELPELPGARFRFAGDEHGVAILRKGAQEPLLGQKLQMVTPHCDPTVNLYDYYWVHRDGYAHSLWPITGRGCAW